MSFSQIAKASAQTCNSISKRAADLFSSEADRNIFRIARQIESQLSQLASNPGSTVVEIQANDLTEGQILETKTGETLKIVFAEPANRSIVLLENSRAVVMQTAKNNCDVALALEKGKIISDGEHTARPGIKTCEFDFEIETPNAEILPRGTRYSVELNEALAELNGDGPPLAEEEYKVEKGNIEVRIRKIRKNKIAKLGKLKGTKIAKNSFSKKLNLKKGQRAKLKREQKTKLADVIVIEPE